MNVETIWYYTGFVFWIALVWLTIGVLAWLGSQFLHAVALKWGRYSKVSRMLDFLDENEECRNKFYAWTEEKWGKNNEAAKIYSKRSRLKAVLASIKRSGGRDEGGED